MRNRTEIIVAAAIAALIMAAGSDAYGYCGPYESGPESLPCVTVDVRSPQMVDIIILRDEP